MKKKEMPWFNRPGARLKRNEEVIYMNTLYMNTHKKHTAKKHAAKKHTREKDRREDTSVFQESDGGDIT